MEWTERAWQFVNQRPLRSGGGIRLGHSRSGPDEANEPLYYLSASSGLLDSLRQSNVTSLACFRPVLLGLGALISLSLVLSLAGGASSATDSSTGRTLVSYAYYETDDARPNADFFIKHALHSNADFVFILNGQTDLAKTIPKWSNIKVIQRDNTCFDLGAHGKPSPQKKKYSTNQHCARSIILYVVDITRSLFCCANFRPLLRPRVPHFTPQKTVGAR